MSKTTSIEVRTDENGKKHYTLKAEPGTFGVKPQPKEPKNG